MPAIVSSPLLGVLMHAVGAFFAATCYTPQKRVRRWSWQTYWLTQAAFCWFLWPIVGALLTIPELGAVLREAPARDARDRRLRFAGAGGRGPAADLRQLSRRPIPQVTNSHP